MAKPPLKYAVSAVKASRPCTTGASDMVVWMPVSLELEAENTKLKRMYAELALDHELAKEIIAKKPQNPASGERWWNITEKSTASAGRFVW